MNAKDLEQQVKEATGEETVDCASEVTEETVSGENNSEEAASEGNEAEATAENEEAVEERSEEAEEATTEKKGFFKKKEKVDKKDEEIALLKDKNLRQMAEFENFRRRTEAEKAMMFDMGAKNIVEKILPVIDNFERGLATLSEEEKAAPFAQGIEKVYKQMLTELQNAGVKEMDCLNKEFNPDLHNAVMHVEDESLGENIVVEVYQKGYMYKDTVVRHAMVKTAN